MRRWMPLLLPAAWASCGFLYVTLPASPDQYQLDYLGWRMLEGDVPYLDFIDVNWPGSLWLHAASTALFGNAFWSWRALDLALTAATVVFLADLVRRLWGRPAALWALLLYPLLYATAAGTWFAGQPDFNAVHLVFIALWFHWRAWEARRSLWQLGTGLLLAAAVLVKPTLAGAAPLLAVHGWLLAPRGLRGGDLWRHLAFAVAGGVLGLGMALAALLAQGTPASAVWDVAVLANSPGVREMVIDRSLLLDKAWELHASSWHWITVSALLSMAWLLRPGWRDRVAFARGGLLLVMWFTGALSFLVQGRGFGYHLAPCYAAMLLALFAGMGKLTAVAAAGRRGLGRSLAFAAMGVVLLGTATRAATTFRDPALWRLGRLSEREFFARYSGGFINLADACGLAREMKQELADDEPLFIWGTAASVSFLAERQQPTRFYYYPTLLEARPPLAGKWARWFREDLEARPARYALILPEALVPRRKPDVDAIEVVEHLLATRYRKVRNVGIMDLYERKD